MRDRNLSARMQLHVVLPVVSIVLERFHNHAFLCRARVNCFLLGLAYGSPRSLSYLLGCGSPEAEPASLKQGTEMLVVGDHR